MHMHGIDYLAQLSDKSSKVVSGMSSQEHSEFILTCFVWSRSEAPVQTSSDSEKPRLC